MLRLDVGWKKNSSYAALNDSADFLSRRKRLNLTRSSPAAVLICFNRDSRRGNAVKNADRYGIVSIERYGVGRRTRCRIRGGGGGSPLEEMLRNAHGNDGGHQSREDPGEGGRAGAGGASCVAGQPPKQ